jgi:hypothetical protein
VKTTAKREADKLDPPLQTDEQRSQKPRTEGHDHAAVSPAELGGNVDDPTGRPATLEGVPAGYSWVKELDPRGLGKGSADVQPIPASETPMPKVAVGSSGREGNEKRLSDKEGTADQSATGRVELPARMPERAVPPVAASTDERPLTKEEKTAHTLSPEVPVPERPLYTEGGKALFEANAPPPVRGGTFSEQPKPS